MFLICSWPARQTTDEALMGAIVVSQRKYDVAHLLTPHNVDTTQSLLLIHIEILFGTVFWDIMHGELKKLNTFRRKIDC